MTWQWWCLNSREVFFQSRKSCDDPEVVYTAGAVGVSSLALSQDVVLAGEKTEGVEIRCLCVLASNLLLDSARSV